MKKGFTLIELLVVIAIIAILAAILFPVFISAKEAGKQTACSSNLKQWGIAFFMYADDNNGSAPYAYNLANEYWHAHLLRYSKNKGIRWCPSKPPLVTAQGLSYGDGRYNTHYAMACAYERGIGRWENSNDPEKKKPFKLSQAKSAKSLVAFLEASNEYAIVYRVCKANDLRWGMYAAGPLGYEKPTDTNCGDYTRHKGGSNFCFVDGHVKWAKPESMKYLRLWFVDAQ